MVSVFSELLNLKINDILQTPDSRSSENTTQDKYKHKRKQLDIKYTNLKTNNKEKNLSTEREKSLYTEE